MNYIQRFLMLKYIYITLILILIPALVKAKEFNKNYLSGTWFVYGFALYQPLNRTVSLYTNKQVVYKLGFSYGLGVGKDYFRVEVSKYMEKYRFLAAFDVFPKSISTPYVGYVYGRALKSKDSSGFIKYMEERGDAVVGISFKPINYFSVYAEYLLRDSFFFAGVRVMIPYTKK